MSIEADIQVLKMLAALDAELSELEGTLSSEREAIDSKRTLLGELDERVRLSSESIQELERTRSQLLAELRQMSSQVDRAREKMARCRNEREANAAQRELEELRKLYRDREHEMEKLIGVADEVRGDVEATSQRRETVVNDLGESEGAASEKIVELERGTEEKRAQRAELGKRLDQTLFRRYEQIRKRRGSGVAEVVNGGCSACHIKLPPMVVQQMMHRTPLQQCPSCNRILYLELPSPQSGEQGQDASSGDPEVSVDQAG